jgi:transposase
MMIIGIDAHKRSHTAVTIDGNGRQQATKLLEQRHKTTSNS